MPYHVVKRGSKFLVKKKDGSKSFGSHDTRAEADAQMAAMYADESRAASNPEGINQYTGHGGAERVKSLHEERKKMMDVQLRQSGTIHSMNAAAREKEIDYELRKIRQSNPEHFKPGTLKPRNAEGLRALHLVGATGAVRTEMWDGREHLVVPVVALQEAVIHAVNSKVPEYVSQAALAASQGKWNGHPLVVGHPVRDGRQISAHTPEGRVAHFGFIRQASMTGSRLGMEAMVDPARLRELKQDQLLADLEAGKPIEVSVGAFVDTNDVKGAFGGRAYDGEWTSIQPDHLAFLPGGVGACSLAMGCGAHRAAMLVTAEEFKVLDNPEGINQYSGTGHEAIARAHSDKLRGVKGLSMTIKDLKARVLALFDTPEQAASEEAAELVAYNAMRTQMDAVGDQWDAASELIDALIADEDETPTETAAQEDAEEEVEDARLDAIRMHCYSMIAALQSVCNACSEQQMPDAPSVSDPRYMEQLRDLDNPEGHNQYMGSGGGANHSMSNPPTKGARVQVHNPGGDHHGKTGVVTTKMNGAGNVAVKWDEKPAGYGQGSTSSHHVSTLRSLMVRGLIGKAISAKNMKTIQAAHDSSHDVHTQTVALGAECNGMKLLAAAEDCPTCGGAGQVKEDDGKQQDCPTCGGTGELKTAEFKAACGCQGDGTMTKEARTAAIKALTEHGGFTAADLKMLEAATDDRLEAMALQFGAKEGMRAAATKADAEKVIADKHAADTALQSHAQMMKDKAAKDEPKAAEQRAAAQAEFLEANPEIKALVDRQKAQDAAEKAALVTKLVAASKALTKVQLEAKSLEDLKTLAAFAKVDVVVDYSVKGVPVPRTAEQVESYAPPNPYEAGLKALQS